jgi:hypothetical protein
VPHAVTAEQRQHWVECCLSLIKFVDQDHNVLQRTVTGEESWWFQFDPEMRQQSMEECGTNSPQQKTPVAKNMCQDNTGHFFYAPGIIRCAFVSEGTTVNSHYYLAVTEHLYVHMCYVISEHFQNNAGRYSMTKHPLTVH